MPDNCFPVLSDYPLDLRLPDTSTLNRLQADPAFEWGNTTARYDFWANLWEVFLRFLGKLFKKLPPNFSIEPYWDAFTYIVIGIAVILIVLKLLNTDLRGLFFRASRNKKGLAYETLLEDIHKIDFEQDIEEAVRQKMYRKAIRLYYLKSLKILSDRHLIEWKMDKTNRDYRRELRNSVVGEAFAELTLLFDYIWYGEFVIDELSFLKAKENFMAFEQRLK